MPDVPDYDLLKTPDEPSRPPRPRRMVGVWIVVAVLVAATAIAAYIVFGRRQPAAPAAETAARTEAPAPQPQPLGGDAAPIALPPLDQSDAVVRELVRKLSSHPRVAAWLATDGLVRNIAVVVTNVAEGRTPAAQLRPLRPESRFEVVERGEDLVIDPRSYERYDSLAAAAASIDPAGAARLYATLKPRLEEAHRDLGFPQTPFDRTLERAIVLLLETPIVEDPVRVEPHGAAGYVFAAADLERLTAAQKQLLRTGPDNVRVIQSSLRSIALALGIPASRLPLGRTWREAD